MRPRALRPRFAAALPLLLGLLTACALDGRGDGAAANGYDVTIRRDGHGVPHIPVTGGTSFIMVLEFTDRGPRARALLLNGQTGDTASTRFWEQTELYAAKRWRDVRFTDDEIRADPGLTTTRLRGPRTP